MAHILVVEDDEATREFFRFVMENAGHRVEVVADGQAALDAVAVRPPDLILLDVMLPEVHGYEVCHRVKSSEKTRKIKIIVLTAKQFPADRRQAEDVGADHFLAKPVDPKTLVETVRVILDGGKPPAVP